MRQLQTQPILGLYILLALVFLPQTKAEEVRLDSFLESYCLDCHDSESNRGELNLELFATDQPDAHPEVWEKAIRRLGARQMPPANRKKRPSENEYQEVIAGLIKQLDAAAMDVPNPGDVPSMRRLTRTEYRNAIRDLLDVEIDVDQLLPKDESSHGFDNITVSSLSSTLLDRYVSAAQKISRVAAGGIQGSAQVRVVRMPADRTQEEHVPGLPVGTRGGVLIPHTFPVDGEYEIDIRLARDRNEEVEGLHGSHEVLVLVNREKKAQLTVKPPPGRKDFSIVDANLKKRIEISRGTHELGVTFLMKSRSLLETKREPYDAQFNKHRHPRQSPAVFQVTITGPFEKGIEDVMGFTRVSPGASNPATDAKSFLRPLMRKAFRRSITEKDLGRPMAAFQKAYEDRELYEDGLEAALSSILVSPQFLFRIERPPADAKPMDVYRISEFEFASRLAFFLWSSVPDDELLDLAESGKLSHPDTLEKQVRRMLADPRSESLSINFANQWLQLRNLESMAPDLRMFPDFDDNLRQSLIRETELFFQSIVDEDRSVVDLLGADYTFLNERLAKHYDIPHVFGSRFRKITLDSASKRGGLLRHGSFLMVTSYANRTSPVIRGNWILDNVLGTPTPPPPPDIPALEDAVVDASLPMRQRLAVHREDRSCAACHNLMDPVGFALENFDAVGRWREKEDDEKVDASGGLPDGQSFNGVDGLEEGLLQRPEIFARTVTEKLLTYSLGRGVEAYDAPAVRRIIEESVPGGYKFSDIILGIAKSVPFTMRTAP